ncbi:uncharacterized protein LOC127102269 [Lathyrus oleraceus]|uniref:uncharacterized protein LOC127102269 n=1 Tax=Pisum sativum TaxID=3888 RepID=UPI0021D320BB|nr:uncharacterized protein LOC127102269 [Pisum sativum]
MSLGKGYFDFSFSSLEDSRRVRSVNSWSLNPGYLKLFTWTKDFNSSSLKQTFAQVWIHIHGLSQEYWRPKINFAIASSIRTPFCTDFAIIKSCFDRPFGHYVRVLVDLDLYNELRSENVNVEVNDEVNHATDLIGKDLYVSDKVPVDVGETSLARNITINIPSATVGFPLPHNSAGKPATKDIPRDIPVEDFIEHNPRSDVEEVLEVVPETQLIMPNINHYESEHVSNTHGSFKMIPSLESTLQKDIQFLNNTWANVMDQEVDPTNQCDQEAPFQLVISKSKRKVQKKKTHLTSSKTGLGLGVTGEEGAAAAVGRPPLSSLAGLTGGGDGEEDEVAEQLCFQK